MNYTELFLRKVEMRKQEQQHQSEVSYRAAVAANKFKVEKTTALKKIANLLL